MVYIHTSTHIHTHTHMHTHTCTHTRTHTTHTHTHTHTHKDTHTHTQKHTHTHKYTHSRTHIHIFVWFQRDKNPLLQKADAGIPNRHIGIIGSNHPLLLQRWCKREYDGEQCNQSMGNHNNVTSPIINSHICRESLWYCNGQ